MKTCVIGEADPFIARLLKRFAAESGLQTVVARVGQDVVELARQVKPAVVIVEAELPGTMRGWEAVRALRADREICNIPVIICSWLQEADVHALVDEVTGHLQKPELLYEDFAAALKTAPPAPRLRGGARFPPRLGGQGGCQFHPPWRWARHGYLP